MKKLLVAAAITSTLFLTGCQTMGGVTVSEDVSVSIPKNQTLSGDLGKIVEMRSKCNSSGGNRPLPNKIVMKSQTNCAAAGGGITTTWKQRNEYTGKPIPTFEKAKYVFESDLSYDIGRNEFSEETIFQLHNGSKGCAPSLSLTLKKSNVIRLKSGYIGGKVVRLNSKNRPGFNNDQVASRGHEYCRDDILTKERVTDATSLKEYNNAPRARDTGKNYIKKDGTVARFRVEVDFPGDGSFEVRVFVNGEKVTSGFYNPPVFDSRFDTPKQVHINFGNYSAEKIDYTMIWENPRVLRVE